MIFHLVQMICVWSSTKITQLVGISLFLNMAIFLLIFYSEIRSILLFKLRTIYVYGIFYKDSSFHQDQAELVYK
jgi:hypothetical protein